MNSKLEGGSYEDIFQKFVGIGVTPGIGQGKVIPVMGKSCRKRK